MRWAAGCREVLAAAALAGTLTCCSSAPAHPVLATPTPPLGVPTEVLQDVQRAVDRFDAAAGGPVSAQQAALGALLDSGQRSVQRHCAAATTTLSFDPVYGRLAPAPGWRPNQGTLSGAVYALPTLIRIYTGNRMTGTDLTDLHLAVQGGRAWFPALCLS